MLIDFLQITEQEVREQFYSRGGRWKAPEIAWWKNGHLLWPRRDSHSRTSTSWHQHMASAKLEKVKYVVIFALAFSHGRAKRCYYFFSNSYLWCWVGWAWPKHSWPKCLLSKWICSWEQRLLHRASRELNLTSASQRSRSPSKLESWSLKLCYKFCQAKF